MKRNKLFLLPLFMLLLAGCRDVSSSSKPEPSDSTPPVVSSEPSEDPSSEDPISEPSESSSEEESLPPIVDPDDPDIEQVTIEYLRGLTSGNESASTAQKEQKYEVSGKVTHKFRGAVLDSNPAWNIAIQDDNHNALLLYALSEAEYAEDFADVPLGAELTVTGHLATYNGLRELSLVKYVSHEEGDPIAPLAIESVKKADLVGKDSVLVEIDGLKLGRKPNLEASVSDTGRTNITVDLELLKGEDKIATYMHYNVPMVDAEATVALLETVKSTDSIKWTGILGMNSGDYQLTNASADEWDITKGGPVVLTKLDFAKEAYEVVEDQTVSVSVLPTPFDASLDGLVYASSDALIATVDGEGVVTGVKAGKANITATIGEVTATVEVTVTPKPEVPAIELVKFDFEDYTANTWGYATTSIIKDDLEFSVKETRVDFDASDSASATEANGEKVLRLRGANTAHIESPVFENVTDVVLDAKYYNSSHTAAKMVVSYKLEGTDVWVEAKDLELTASYEEYVIPINKDNVAVRIDATAKTSNLDNLVIKGVGEEPEVPAVVENFATLPAGHTAIAAILSDGVVDDSYTTRGVILGTNGGAFYIQDPLSGAALGGFGLNSTPELKPLLHPGTVVDVTGEYKVNNNGGQLDKAVVTIVAEENLSKVEPFVVATGAALTDLLAATDYSKHARLVKLMGVKVLSVEDGGTNRFKVTLDGVEGQVFVNFMDSADALDKNRPEIKALVTQLLADETVFNLTVIQTAQGGGGFSLAIGTLDYFEFIEEQFDALPAGHTAIAAILSDGVIDDTYTTRGVILGTNGGAFYIQDPVSGAALGGFGLNATPAIKDLLHPGTVVDVTGVYKVNNNGGQLDSAVVTVVAPENYTKVAPHVIDTGAALTSLIASTDYDNHARLVKLVGVKVLSVEDGGTNRFKVILDGVEAQVFVNFMDSADALGKNRPAVKALATQLLDDEAVFDLLVIQTAQGGGGFSFALGTTDYFLV